MPTFTLWFLRGTESVTQIVHLDAVPSVVALFRSNGWTLAAQMETV